MPENDIGSNTSLEFSQPPAQLADTIWGHILEVAKIAGLDTDKFGDEHKEIVGRVAAFLTTDLSDKQENDDKKEPSRGWGITWRKKEKPAKVITALSPIVICGVPGTGKTTFLYVLDRVLRMYIRLPDTLDVEMTNVQGRSYRVPKRMFCGAPVSLLSVRKWSELHRFYAWDTAKHKFEKARLDSFITQTLAPMRIVFADEVEPSGYSPTLPDMTSRNLLVIGTSNQYDFPQLELEANSPIIYRFEGPDLRSGDPADAIVWPYETAWDLFDQLEQQPPQNAERLTYRTMVSDDTVTMMVDFRQAVQAPMYETAWFEFLKKSWDDATGRPGTLQPDSNYALLIQRFTLDELRTDYNSIIRFVWLFDAIEQLGIGVLIRNGEEPAELSREAFNHMKVTIQTSRNVTEEVRERALVGIDRVVSRIGQAGVRARSIYDLD